MQFDNKTNLNDYFIRMQRRQLAANVNAMCKMGLAKEDKENGTIKQVYGSRFGRTTWKIGQHDRESNKSYYRDYWDVKSRKRKCLFHFRI